jgi:DNA-binding response OmpR family regulator
VNQSRGHVLVIDDEVGVRDLLSYELTHEGFDVTCAPNGMVAIALVRSRHFDVAVADFKMAGMNGAETVQALKAIDPDLEIIVATAHTSTANVVECMRRGAYDLVEKPYDVADLIRLLEAAMVKTHLDPVTALHAASAALVAAASNEAFPQRAVDEAARIVPVSAAGLQLDAPGGAVCYRAASGAAISDAFLAQLVREGLDAGEPALLPARGAQAPLTGPDGERFRCAAVCPLHGASGSLGGLVLLRRDDLPIFTPQEVQAIGSLATVIALIVEGRRLRSR